MSQTLLPEPKHRGRAHESAPAPLEQAPLDQAPLEQVRPGPMALLSKLEYLNQIGVSLSQEPDINKLLETIVLAAKNLTRADGGTLYRLVDDQLRFEIVRNDSLSIAMGGSSGNPVPFPPVPLHDADGRPNYAMIAAYAALTQKTVNIADAYVEEGFDFSGTRNFDKRTGYRSTSFLTVPMKNHEGNVIGVLQLLNAVDAESGKVVRFGEEDQRLAESLASQAAIALTNTQLIQQLEVLFRVRQQMSGHVQSKYVYLVIDNVIAAAELELATRNARRKGVSVEEVLIDDFQVKTEALGAALAKFYGVEYEPYSPDRVNSPELLKNIKRDYADGNRWIPLENTKRGIVVVSTDPERVRNTRMVENVFPRSKIVYKVTTELEFTQTLNQIFGGNAAMGGESIDEMLTALGDEDESSDTTTADLMNAAADNELVKLVNKIIVDAYSQGASDIHIEPRPGHVKTRVRFRKDGSLHPYIEVPAMHRDALVTRLKIMCDLDISEKRKPQDGKIKFRKFGPLDIELRVATIPTAGGVEDVVMRILAAGEPLPLDKLGVLPRNMERLKKCISKPYGLFFVCGPTGSGKTTTLHSVLGYLNTPDTKIWTAEDPVEITQNGLRQCQVNPKAGFTFATAMKSFLRADPDIIMVGEMRDKETTAIGIEASLTGHLVFATLHTNSAPESVIRLLDMGMDPFNFSDALLGILAQRLAKRLCKCKESYAPSEEERKTFLNEYCEELRNTEEFKKDMEAGYQRVFDRFQKDYGFGKPEFRLYKPKGCKACDGTGYKGRVGLHELMVGTDTVKKMIQEHARVAELFAQALSDGMLTLKMDGMEKVLQGITDVPQVRAVCVK